MGASLGDGDEIGCNCFMQVLSAGVVWLGILDVVGDAKSKCQFKIETILLYLRLLTASCRSRPS